MVTSSPSASSKAHWPFPAETASSASRLKWLLVPPSGEMSPSRGHAGEHPPEVSDVLGPVERADPASAGVPEDKPGLQAPDPLVGRRGGAEAGDGLEQLVRF